MLNSIRQSILKAFFFIRLSGSTTLFIFLPFIKLKTYITFVTQSNRPEVNIFGKLDSSKNYIIISNHKSWYDFFYIRDFLFRYVNDFNCTGMHKAGLGYRLYAKALKFRGDYYFCNLDKEVIKKNVSLIKEGYHCMLFPEGTRNRTTTPLLCFKKGIEQIIKNTESEILFIDLKNTEKISKGITIKPIINAKLFNRKSIQNNTIESAYRDLFNL